MDSACWCVPVLFLAAAVSGRFQVESQDRTLVAEVGSDAFLHCTLSPPLGLTGLTVHWFRSLFHSTVLLLKNGKEERDQQSAEYSGRASLQGRTDAGDLTLVLHNVSLSDADTYHCLVENISSTQYEEAVTELIVIGSGSLPSVAVSLEDGAIAVSFVTSDWFPWPQMRWRVDGVPVVTDRLEFIHNQSNGLYQLESKILLKDPDAGPLYGAARHPVTGKEFGLYMTLAEDMFPRISSWAYAFLFTLALLIVGAALAAYYMKKQKEQKVMDSKRIDKLSSEVDWRRAVMNPETITLSPETAHPRLSVTDDFLTLLNRPPAVPAPPCNARFETERCCLGLPPFSSGCHYWEVELGDGVEWAVGVATPQVRRTGDAYMFRPQEHIWCISRFTETIKALDNPESTLDVADGPLSVVGVYLNLSGPRTITFYDPRNWDELYTFRHVAQERETVRPFFWLGTNGGEVTLRRSVRRGWRE
ncbi:butyrophilin subfamily 2 member A2-like [Pseudophryne corroboree]|uniref:butyrophilin subfamily 2 member A2-like n=1 Tax=Pseudophryne corroboree TaxID=495146 RepID=UPI003081DF3B